MDLWIWIVLGLVLLALLVMMVVAGTSASRRSPGAGEPPRDDDLGAD